MNSRKTIIIFCGLVLLTLLLLVVVIKDALRLTHHTPGAREARAIANAYQAWTTSTASTRVIPLEAKPGDTAHFAAYMLAKEANLKDFFLWFISIDPKRPDYHYPNIPPILDSSNNNQLNPDFAQATLSFEFAANIPNKAPPTTTPLLWSRGLREDGTWSKDSPFKGKGGLIAYLDGHVEWVDKLSTKSGEVCLVKFGTNTPTVNIREALPPGAIILRAEPNSAATAK